MSSHAYLICAHENFHVLDRLIRLLDDRRNALYLHVDRKAGPIDVAAWTGRCRHASLTWMPRSSIHWGDYSLLECTFRLFERATADGHDYYHLVSGADLPLQTQDDLHAFFDRHAGTEFVGFAPTFDPSWVSEIHVLTRHLRSRHRAVVSLRGLFARAFGRLQRQLGYDRTRGLDLEIRKGCDWYSISDALARYLLANESKLKALLKHALVPSEFAMQTLVWNSPFRERVHDLRDEYASCMRLIDWTRGEPYVFRSDDLDELKRSTRLFARKFQETVDRDVVDALYAHLTGASSSTGPAAER